MLENIERFENSMTPLISLFHDSITQTAACVFVLLCVRGACPEACRNRCASAPVLLLRSRRRDPNPNPIRSLHNAAVFVLQGFDCSGSSLLCLTVSTRSLVVLQVICKVLDSLVWSLFSTEVSG